MPPPEIIGGVLRDAGAKVFSLLIITMFKIHYIYDKTISTLSAFLSW